MVYLDNPAGRLLTAFQSLRKVAPNTLAIKAWSAFFDINPQNRHEFMVRVSQLYSYADETKRLINEAPDAAPEIYLRHFSEVEEALSLFLTVRDVNVQQFLSPISEKSGEYCLEICSHLLHTQKIESGIGDDARESLIEQLNGLIESVEDDLRLNPNDRTWILKRLKEIHDTLSRPDLFSPEDLEHASDKLLGGLRRKIQFLQSFKDVDIKTKLITFVVALDLAINLAANTHELVASDEPPRPSPVIIEIQNHIGWPATLPALPSGKSGDSE